LGMRRRILMIMNQKIRKVVENILLPLLLPVIDVKLDLPMYNGKCSA